MIGSEKKIDLTVQWLKEQVESSKTNGLIVGVSGGIDSALCSYLIKKAFPDNSLGVIMPCESNPDDTKDALKVVTNCGLKYLEIDLSSIHNKLFKMVSDKLVDVNEKLRLELASANLKARLRMSTLYAVANSLNYLVVGTDNAAEIYTGYFTKYGDGGVDILPIARLTKREVRDWSQTLGIPQEIINKTPSAGLWDNQTDEDDLGTTYNIIDDFLEGKDIPEKDRLIIEKLHKISYHKRQTPLLPPEFKI
ncbi:MAG: NAD(+) synthase [Peptococcales bacterium]